MSVEIKKDITTVQVEVPKTNVAVENAVTNINVQVSQPQLTISQAGVSGRDGTSGTSGTFGNVLSSSLYISGSIVPNVAEGDLTSSFSLGSSTNAWKDLWISKGTIYFIGDNNQTASISINADNQIVVNDINLTGSFTASLAEGYLWVGGPNNITKLIATSSLVTGGSGTSGVDGTSGTSGISITGSAGTSGIDGSSGTSGTSGLTITGSAGSNGTSGTSGISVLMDSGSLLTTSSFNEYSSSIDLRIIALEYSASISISGSNGSSGIDGTSGTSGLTITGSAGTSGVDGKSGTSGLSITGSAGSHGTSGTSGISPASIDGLISGSQQIYDLGFIGTSQAIVDTGSFATTGSNQFSGSQYIISGGLVFNNGVQLYEDDSDLYIQSLSEIRVRANGNNYKFGNDGNFYTSVGGVVFSGDGLINQIPGASGDNINIVVGINDSIVLTTDAGDGDYAWDFDKNGDLTVPGNIYGATNLATKGSNIFDGNQIMTGSLVVSGSADFTELRVTGDLSVLGKITGSLLATNGVISSSQQITDFGFVSSSTADTTLLNNFTGSIRAEIDGIEAYTASLKATTLISGAAQITALGFGAGGGDVTALNTYTSSNDVVLQRIMQTTASLNIVTGSFARIWQTTASLNTFTGSIRGEVNGLEAYTASLKAATLISSSTQIVNFATFATLNANNFNGTQIITGSLIVSSTAISEATLFASASNLVLNSGSNLQINNSGLATINNRLQVSGSTILSGSTEIIGSTILSGSLFISGTTEFGGDLVPKTARGATLGTIDRPFRDIFIQSASINIQSDTPGVPNTTISNIGGNLLVSAGGMRLLGSASFVAETGSFSYISGSMTQVGDYTQTGNYKIIGHKQITGSLDVKGNINVASGSGFYYEGNKLYNRGQFYHTATLSGSANTAYPFQFNTTDTSVTNGSIYVADNSKIYVKHTGIYNLQISAQLHTTIAEAVDFSIWFSMTGSNIANSNTEITIERQSGGGYTLATLNYLLPISSGSYTEIYYSKNTANGEIEAKGTQSTPIRPATPSVILTVTQVG